LSKITTIYLMQFICSASTQAFLTAPRLALNEAAMAPNDADQGFHHAKSRQPHGAARCLSSQLKTK